MKFFSLRIYFFQGLSKMKPFPNLTHLTLKNEYDVSGDGRCRLKGLEPTAQRDLFCPKWGGDSSKHPVPLKKNLQLVSLTQGGSSFTFLTSQPTTLRVQFFTPFFFPLARRDSLSTHSDPLTVKDVLGLRVWLVSWETCRTSHFPVGPLHTSDGRGRQDKLLQGYHIKLIRHLLLSRSREKKTKIINDLSDINR